MLMDIGSDRKLAAHVGNGFGSLLIHLTRAWLLAGHIA